VLDELKTEPQVANFLQPVDWRGLGLVDYPNVIKTPMDVH
jgi:hypothetical protein